MHVYYHTHMKLLYVNASGAMHSCIRIHCLLPIFFRDADRKEAAAVSSTVDSSSAGREHSPTEASHQTPSSGCKPRIKLDDTRDARHCFRTSPIGAQKG